MKLNDFVKTGSEPPSAFYFSVEFQGSDEMDSGFQEVSGLKSTFGVEGNMEDGEDHFVHRLPTAPKFENLVLKRCLRPNSNLDKWCRDTFNNLVFDPRDIKIALLGVGDSDQMNGQPKVLASWIVFKAFPVSWELAALDSSSNKLAIEALTLSYRYFKREI